MERRHRRERVVVERRAVGERRAGAPVPLPDVEAVPPPLPPGVPEADLARGMRGPEVSALQKLLRARGLLTEGAARQEPGRLGEATLAALQALQRLLDVPATGFYGPLTREALAREAADGARRGRVAGR